jgi:hypothetical protein
MQIVEYLFGKNISDSSSNISNEEMKLDPSTLCALRALQPKPSSNSPSLTNRDITADPSARIFHFLTKKYIEQETQESFTFTSYLTFEDLQLFKVRTKKIMQSEYVSLLNKLNGSLEHTELTNSLKKLFLLLFYKIDPSVANDQGERLPELIATHQKSLGTCDINKELLGQVYTKYLLISES